MINTNDINREVSEYIFENYDSQFSDIKKYNAFDPYIITDFMQILHESTQFISSVILVKRFIDYLKSRKPQTDKAEELKGKVGNSKDGTIGITTLHPGNILMMKGNGSKKPVIEACDTIPLFNIQRGYILILSNLIIHFNYDRQKLVKEYKAPAFMWDDTVEFKKTSFCDETPGLFRIKTTVYLGNSEYTEGK
ncbi:hypothetical protein [Ferroplasma sp.]|uniref:hypothetical protein n=1 Tax=Ferroplasma sp. TaxID=2591003 RepID=UPI00263455F4|nr:hypothetical protein [Ferroplasma sp.]